ncbi:MAG: DUF1428 domain-containing protein [Gammaproteobacteria bacterium]|nr:DUF1428 domain-containing protein [Gammaproteobacteria bacterium]
MSYIDGFLLAVPKANREKFIEFAAFIDPLFLELGATRVVECWGDELPEGKLTDFYKAVNAKEDETVTLAWVEWPDKETRAQGQKRMHELAQSGDDRFDEDKHPVPFDGVRMVTGGFSMVFEVE